MTAPCSLGDKTELKSLCEPSLLSSQLGGNYNVQAYLPPNPTYEQK